MPSFVVLQNLNWNDIFRLKSTLPPIVHFACVSLALMYDFYFLHQVAAVALIAIGVVMYSSYNTYSEITSADHILAPATIVIAVGIFLLLLGIVGCVGAFKEQKCLLGIVSYSSVSWETTSRE